MRKQSVNNKLLLKLIGHSSVMPRKIVAPCVVDMMSVALPSLEAVGSAHEIETTPEICAMIEATQQEQQSKACTIVCAEAVQRICDALTCDRICSRASCTLCTLVKGG